MQLRTHNTILIFLSVFISGFFICEIAFSQAVKIKMVNGNEISGILLSITTDRVSVDPEGSVTYLSLSSNELESITFPDGLILTFPITENKIPEEYKKKQIKRDTDFESHYYSSYFESYYFGGFSSQKTIMQFIYLNDDSTTDIADMIYKNSGLGGVGLSWMDIGKNRNPDWMVDVEFSIYGAEMLAKVHDDEFKLLTGIALCMDMHFSFFPIKARNKYPSPFIFAGFGCRLVSMSPKGNSNAFASEFHGELPFGLGLRQKISKRVAIQIRERFVYSKLKGIDGFILPETRFELFITLSKS